MDILNGLMLGLDSALQPVTLLYCFIGVFLGTLIGVLPGIGALATISLLLPITYHIPPTAAIVMLAGVYYGAQYGGSTASILLNLPGTPSSAVACLDGYPMAKQGRAGVALFMTTIASFVGSMLGILALVLFSPAIAELGLKFGAAEYFAMMLLGLIAASALASGSPAKGLSMVVLGLLLGTVGTDVNSGQARFDFGIPELMDGINLVALAMGMFGIAEVVSSINQVRGSDVKEKISMRSMTPTRKDVKDSIMPMLRGTGIGSFFGALPGTGASIASFMSYAVEKKIAKDPSRFGNGAIEGITAPEAANNAAAQTAFVPTLSLGIPGDAVMALMLGALIIHGIQPGPMLMSQQPDLFWGLIVSFGIGNIMLMVLNLPLIGLWVAILRIPYRVLFPAILVFISLGVYSVNNNTFDVLMVAAIGSMGYLLAVFKFEAAPLLLGFVLGPLMEENLRRALLLSRGELSTFIERPISAGFLAFGAAILLWSAWGSLKEFMRAREKEADAQQV
ncbi:MAG: tripartite tricarboxylate transporter permease [Hydrogenophaga sp.]|uniref:tripartite tricarboxylate transporter permease n=1 Tax=Hydrogenophaga sp. TaxID=1904254 RepID=UPI00272272FF|nr:tripartite tricarboxylate transporter permease [Hydrogenophaga sp.]MDO9569610.1 tripartite tricarboxylate transporter permease [Hydrogenophaga sp.]